MGVVVNLEGERKAKPSLDPLSALVADDLMAVNKLVVQRMDSSVSLIPQLAGHIVAAGGKRLRPMLTLAHLREQRQSYSDDLAVLGETGYRLFEEVLLLSCGFVDVLWESTEC